MPGVHFTSYSGKITKPLETYYGKKGDQDKKMLAKAYLDAKLESQYKQEVEGTAKKELKQELDPYNFSEGKIF